MLQLPEWGLQAGLGPNLLSVTSAYDVEVSAELPRSGAKQVNRYRTVILEVPDPEVAFWMHPWYKAPQ
jgi:hypothetical protein